MKFQIRSKWANVGALPRGRTVVMVALALLISIPAFGQPTTRTARDIQLDQDIRGLSKVRTSLETSQRPIRVLAQYSQVTVDPDASRTNALPMRGLAAATLSSATQKVRTTLANQGIANVRPIKGLPLVTFELKRNQLTEMAESGQFAIVVEDKLSMPYLGSSGPVINVQELHDLEGTGDGQAVAILDTGVDTDHPFLNGRVVEGACYSSNFAPHGRRACARVARIMLPLSPQVTTARAFPVVTTAPMSLVLQRAEALARSRLPALLPMQTSWLSRFFRDLMTRQADRIRAPA